MTPKCLRLSCLFSGPFWSSSVEIITESGMKGKIEVEGGHGIHLISSHKSNLCLKPIVCSLASQKHRNCKLLRFQVANCRSQFEVQMSQTQRRGMKSQSAAFRNQKLQIAMSFRPQKMQTSQLCTRLEFTKSPPRFLGSAILNRNDSSFRGRKISPKVFCPKFSLRPRWGHGRPISAFENFRGPARSF